MFDLFKRTSQGVAKSRQQWFRKIACLFSTGGIDESVWTQLEELLVSADVSISTTTKLLENVRTKAKEQRLSQGPDIYKLLKQEIVNLLSIPMGNEQVNNLSGSNKSRLILVVGVNGSGKTTSIAKLAHYYSGSGAKVVLGAGDT